MAYSCPVVGTGAISSAGKGAENGYRNILKGESFLSPLSLFKWNSGEKPLVGEISDFDKSSSYSRTEALATNAVEEAIADIDLSALKVGIIVATTIGGVDQLEKEYHSTGAESAAAGKDRYVRNEAGALSGFLAKKFNCNGFHTVSSACSSGLHAIGMARRLIETKQYDAVITVGSDALLKLTLNGFNSLLLIDPKGPHPFDADRLGISIGEAAGAVLLMSNEAAEKRAENPLCYITGWGATADAFHITAPHPDGDGAKRAITEALEDSGIKADDIDWILTHGTSTIDNDRAEIEALKSVFNDKLPPFTSIKGSIGHTLSASGSVEIVYAIEAIKAGEIPPTLGFTKIDPEIGVAPAKAGKLKLNTVLKTAFGFGGNNGALIISGEKK